MAKIKEKAKFPKKIFVPESQLPNNDDSTYVGGYRKENDALERHQENVATYVLKEIRKGKLVPKFKALD